MKSVVDSYVGLWLIMVFLMLCIAFTSINLNVVQARRMYNDIKSSVQASNGAYVSDDGYFFQSNSNFPTNPSSIFTAAGLSGTPTKVSATADQEKTLAKDSYDYYYIIQRQDMTAVTGEKADLNETWIYNDLYKITFVYRYNIPLFGKQVYPIVGFTY